MDELVAEHVIGRFNRPRKRQHDAPLRGFCHTAGSLAELSLDRVRLPEMGPARVENQRLPAAQLVTEDGRQPRVPTFGQARRHAGRILFFRIEIDVEVISLEEFEVELLILHLVAAEVAALSQGKGRREERRRE
jgi:hypothetical protein